MHFYLYIGLIKWSPFVVGTVSIVSDIPENGS